MPYKAHAKVNIFLKMVGTRGAYHELLSRFMRVSTLYDTLCFVPKKGLEPFELVGDFDCALENNTLYKAFIALKAEGFGDVLDALMGEYALHVSKKIPTGAGLGGGSSDAATFLIMLNDKAHLGLTCNALMDIGARIGADIPFFISGFKSANVRGIGEVVESFCEEALELEVLTPPIACHTGKVYSTFREYFMQTMDKGSAEEMLGLSSTELLHTFSKEALNDLYAPALKCYPALEAYAKEGWFFSGSGSSFFRILNEVK